MAPPSAPGPRSSGGPRISTAPRSSGRPRFRSCQGSQRPALREKDDVAIVFEEKELFEHHGKQDLPHHHSLLHPPNTPPSLHTPVGLRVIPQLRFCYVFCWCGKGGGFCCLPLVQGCVLCLLFIRESVFGCSCAGGVAFFVKHPPAPPPHQQQKNTNNKIKMHK